MTELRPEPLDDAVVQAIQTAVARAIGAEAQNREASGQRALTGDDEQQYALTLIQAEVDVHLQQAILRGENVAADRSYEEHLASAVFSRMYASGVLQELLDNEAVENIDINGCDQVWVSYAGDPTPRKYPPLWGSDAEMVTAIQGLAAHAGVNPRPWTRANPELGLRLSDGSRLSAVMGAGDRPAISVRRNRFAQMFLPKLVELGTIDARLATFLQAFMHARCNGMIGGSVNTGKTTLMRALLNTLPVDERLVVVEMSQELCLARHPDLHSNVVEWEEILPDSDGNGGLSMSELVRQSLRFNASRAIVGEILGEEVTALLNVMGQGNGGSLGTIHCLSSEAALDRIATYAAQASNRQGFDVTHALIAGAIDFIIYLHRDPVTNARSVTEVREITGFDGQRATSHLIFATPNGHTGPAMRTPYPLTDGRRQRLEAAGYNDDAAVWGHGY